MTTEEKIAKVQSLIDDDAEEATDTVVRQYLDLAEQKMLDRIYPFGETLSSRLPRRYERLQCELAVRYFLRRGAEGEETHEENGVNRAYGSVDDEDILSRLTPFAAVMY